MKKFLITGTNGLLGQKLVYALLERIDVEVIATSRGKNRIKRKDGYVYETLDITDKKAVENVFEKYQPDTVINTAAMTNVDACETNKEECEKQNIIAVKNIIDTLENLKFKVSTQKSSIFNFQSSIIYSPHLIHLSTDFVFDGEDGPYKEDAQPNPLSYYAKSKYESEKLVQKSMLRWAIVRTIIIYGIVDDMSRSNLILWAKGALEKGQTINVVDDQFRAPTLAEDLADGCILVAMKEAEGIYHISGKETKSILELVYEVADFYDLDKSLIHPVSSDTLNQPAKRPPHTGFILDKANNDLGYQPHSFKEGMEIVTRQLGN